MLPPQLLAFHDDGQRPTTRVQSLATPTGHKQTNKLTNKQTKAVARHLSPQDHSTRIAKLAETNRKAKQSTQHHLKREREKRRRGGEKAVLTNKGRLYET